MNSIILLTPHRQDLEMLAAKSALLANTVSASGRGVFKGRIVRAGLVISPACTDSFRPKPRSVVIRCRRPILFYDSRLNSNSVMSIACYLHPPRNNPTIRVRVPKWRSASRRSLHGPAHAGRKEIFESQSDRSDRHS